MILHAKAVDVVLHGLPGRLACILRYKDWLDPRAVAEESDAAVSGPAKAPGRCRVYVAMHNRESWRLP